MSKKQNDNDIEVLQQFVARTIANQPVGRNLALIGGFRYRFLDEGVRTSDDIDYHWTGDLAEKQNELVVSLRRVLLPAIFRRFGYAGSVNARTGLEADSSVVRIADLAFWKDGVPYSRIEIPVDVTRIICADSVQVRTVGGTIYATVSEGDMIESKVIAIFGRIRLMHRDIVDVYLFQDRFLADSAQRLVSKLDELKITSTDIESKMIDLREHGDYHAKAVQLVIDSQLDPDAAAQLNDAGGGQMVLDTIMALLATYIRTEGSDEIN